jgi:NADH-quinone oxidoreductase subunit N
MSVILPILPEVLLLAMAVLILILDPFLKKGANHRSFLGMFTVIGLFVILTLNLFFARPADPNLVFGGMLRFDWLGFLFKMFFVFAAAVTALFFMDADKLNQRAEAYLLLLAATIGMCLMSSSADLVMLYLAIETTSIPLYILAGFLTGDDKSTESGFKYLLFGAMTSAVLLYGFSLIYGFAGTTSLYDLSIHFSNFDFLAVGITFLVLAGLAFKVSLFPFHFWAPDV